MNTHTYRAVITTGLRLSSILLLSSLCIMSFTGGVLAANTTDTETASLKQQLNDDAQYAVHIEPYRAVHVSKNTIAETVLEPTKTGEYQLQRQTEIGLPSIPAIFNSQKPKDYIHFYGDTVPTAFVSITIRSEDAQTEVTRANSTGKWELIIVVDSLPAGLHAAYITIEYEQVRSDEFKIAEFVVLNTDAVSNTTWLFVVMVGLIIIIILLIINIQFHIRRIREDRSAIPPPIATSSDQMMEASPDEEAIVEAIPGAEKLDYGTQIDSDKKDLQ